MRERTILLNFSMPLSSSVGLTSQDTPFRYHNAYGAGSPFEFYDEKTAREAIEYSGVNLEFIEKQGHD